ncbi:MAG: MBL fold metallo-hydrolase [Rhizobiales bacterium]|nr:MBL fold metallo-hydrolase [Hyphomicrobiales bacterium]
MYRLVELSRSCLAGIIALIAFASQGATQERQQPPAAKPEMAESCPGLVASNHPRVIPAAFKLAALAADQVRITYIGHSTFLIESPRLVRIATDFNDYVRPPMLPDIVTMNHAHTTHYTENPDSGIKYVLRGWAGDEKPARHDLQVQDVRIRNVPTNIRSWGGTTERHGNSIFIFEIGNLCIAHLGHLHHTLTQQQLNEIGRIDVVFFPIDGGVTLDLDGMVEVLQALKAPIMIPMHYFSSFTLNRFLDRVRDKYAVQFNETPSIIMSKSMLPASPQFLVLSGH